MTQLTKEQKLASMRQQIYDALDDGTPASDFHELLIQYVKEFEKLNE